jgi:hypothetical protein
MELVHGGGEGGYAILLEIDDGDCHVALYVC